MFWLSKYNIEDVAWVEKGVFPNHFQVSNNSEKGEMEIILGIQD